MKNIKLYTLLLFLFVVGTLQAQREWLDVEASSSVSVSTNSELNPLWSYSNQWGVYSQYEQAEVIVRGKVGMRLVERENVKLQAGLGLVGSTNFDHSMVHEAFVKGKVYMIDFTAGMEAFSPLAKYDDLTSGSYLMSSNARPTPRVGVGIFDWWSIPYTFDWLQIKGGCYLGMLFNEDNPKYTKDVILHEKFAYGRLGGWYVKPYLGLVHSVMMGGVTPSGEDVPIDFWASFFAKGSEKFREISSMRGEATNAAGGHQGLWDAGLDIETEKLNMSVYLKRPFADASGKKYWDKRNKDYYLGAIIEFKDRKILKCIGFEYLCMDYQAGEGTPDPIGLDKNGKLLVLYPGDIPNEEVLLKEWFYSHFEENVIKSYIEEHGYDNRPYKHTGKAYDFFQEYWGRGYEYGGRSNYLSNGLYLQGLTTGDMGMTSALFHTQATVNRYAGDYKWQGLTAFPNLRLNALTVSAEISPMEKMSVMLKYSITKNKGNRIEKYIGGSFSWIRDESYYFNESKFEHYFMIKGSYSISDRLNVNGLLSADVGEMYDALGMRIGVLYKLATKQ